MDKKSIMIGLGNFYTKFPTGFPALPFVYNNILSLATDLTAVQWNCPPPLFDPAANIKNIQDKFLEIVSSCGKDSWLLFYFTGHATKFFPDPHADPLTYAITYVDGLTEGNFPAMSAFLNGINYQLLAEAFHQKAPQGHLITILDCCYAEGLMNLFLETADYHTIIAASAAEFPALYDDNSVFYKELKKVLFKPFDQLQQLINDSFNAQGIPESCVVKPAAHFSQKSLNPS
jgi:hypothetical protein